MKYEFESAIYYGKKYQLDYEKKIRFEYNYLKLKKIIYKVLNKEKYNSTKNICNYIKKVYIEKREN